MPALKYWLWLATRGGLRRDAIALLERFGDPEDIYFADERDLRQALETGFEPFLDKSMAKPREIAHRCEKERLTVLTLRDSLYPMPLKFIADPPPVLYVRGELPDLEQRPAVTMVGTRSCTPYGAIAAEKLGYEVASFGGVVVTGMARGIDSAAARGALRAGGTVIGVLGCGLDIIYPRSNEPLFHDVTGTGALISEFPPGVPPIASNFPVRNRIMSGMSAAVVVVEAPERSGALITASLALEQGRDVFTVPGNIDAPSCEGSNGLLKEGAVPATCGWDIMGPYAATYPKTVKDPGSVRLQELSREEAEKLTEEETDFEPRHRREKPRPARERMLRKPQKSVPAVQTAKKDIDNSPTPVYIDILIDPETHTLDERTVLAAMKGRLHVDQIINATSLPPQAVMSALTMLEIEGAVTQEPGKYFVPHFRFK